TLGSWDAFLVQLGHQRKGPFPGQNAILKLSNQLHLLWYRAKPPTLVRPFKSLVTVGHPATRPIPDLHPMLVGLPGTFLDRFEFHLSEHRDHRRDSPPHR